MVYSKKKLSKEEVKKVVRKLLKKGQNWSLDLILGIVVFMLILSVFYMILSKDSSTDIKALKTQGNKILNFFDSTKSDSEFAILEGNQVNMTLLEELYKNGDYDRIKEELGITGDFCIILEDSNNRVVVVDNGTGGNVYGFGNDSLNISGCLCGDVCP